MKEGRHYDRNQLEVEKTGVLAKQELTEEVIGAAIDVHRELGPGLLESAYEECLCRELLYRGLRFERQKALPVVYEGEAIDCSYRLDIVVEGDVIVESKAVESLCKLHEAQMLTCSKLSGTTIGLLIDFNVVRLTDGLRRVVLGAVE